MWHLRLLSSRDDWQVRTWLKARYMVSGGLSLWVAHWPHSFCGTGAQKWNKKDYWTEYSLSQCQFSQRFPHPCKVLYPGNDQKKAWRANDSKRNYEPWVVDNPFSCWKAISHISSDAQERTQRNSFDWCPREHYHWLSKQANKRAGRRG